jgi:hypothetical protein
VEAGTRKHRKRRNKPVMIQIAVIDQRTGEEEQLGVRKNIPSKCSTPRRVCIRCRSAVIHKLSRFYESKVCEVCTEKEDASALRPRRTPGLRPGPSPGE